MQKWTTACNVLTYRSTKYDCTRDLCSVMQVITHQFALERFIQSASLFKYCQSLIKCDNGRKLANVGHRRDCECHGLKFIVLILPKTKFQAHSLPRKGYLWNQKNITLDINYAFSNSEELVIKRLAMGNKIISRSQRFCEENQRWKVNSKLGKHRLYKRD